MNTVPLRPVPLALARARSSPRRIQDNLTIAVFLLPGGALFGFLVIFPILQSIYYSFFDWKGFGPAVDFVGLNNFITILSDRVFLLAVKNGLLIITFSLALQLPLALVLATLIGRDLPGRVVFRTVFFLPYVISEVITAMVWLFLYNPDPDRGLINALLVLLPGRLAHPWLGDLNTALPAVFVALTWKYFGYYVLLFLTGILQIPTDIEEAARIDGANSVQTFRHVTVPLLGGTIRTCVYLSVLGSLQQFIVVWIMTKGGPVNATETMATYMYRFGLVYFKLGYGSAVAIYMFLICLAFSIIYQRLTRRPDYLSGM
ncbi:MAG TPA: sugar ABC transporter permease [Anaerolineales bacterium]|nr:sugar ABC transporter permease [Anaerolineales bacterium]